MQFDLHIQFALSLLLRGCHLDSNIPSIFEGAFLWSDGFVRRVHPSELLINCILESEKRVWVMRVLLYLQVVTSTIMMAISFSRPAIPE